jgi:myosin-5
LKRLAEIVSSQAIAQQEKLEYDDFDGEGEVAGEGVNGDGALNGNGHPEMIEEEAAA